MNRTKKFFYNSFFTALLQIVITIVGIILPAVMLECYGSEINGLVSSITQFISYFNLVEAGLANAAVYALYKPLAEKNNDKINKILSTTKKLYFQVGYIFIFLVLGLAVIYPLLVEISSLSYFNIFILVIILGSSGFLDFFLLAKYRALLTADQNVYIISISSIIYYILNTIIIIVLAKLNFNIVFVRFFAVFAIIVRSLILYFYTKHKYNFIKYSESTDNKLLNKRWDALYLQFLGTVQNGAPIILLTVFSNLFNVSIYSIYNMILNGINNLLSIFTTSLSSSFGEIIVKDKLEKLQEVYKEFEYIFYDVLILIYTLTFILIMPFIALYTNDITDVNYYIPLLGTLFVLNGLLYNLKTPQGMLVISAGLYKETKMQSTIQALIIIVFGIILTPKFGISGMMIASILSNLYRVVDLLFFIPKNLTKLPIKNTFYRQLKVFLLGIIIIILTNKLSFKINNYLEWLIYALLSGITSCIVILIFDLIFEKSNLKKLYNRFKSVIGVKN